MEMFSIDQVFDQIFPWLSGISWDLGTILTSLVFLWFLLLGFDWVKVMLFGHLEQKRYIRHADHLYDRAESALKTRDVFDKGSIEWAEQDLMYKRYLRKSVDSRVKGIR